MLDPNIQLDKDNKILDKFSGEEAKDNSKMAKFFNYLKSPESKSLRQRLFGLVFAIPLFVFGYKYSLFIDSGNDYIDIIIMNIIYGFPYMFLTFLPLAAFIVIFYPFIYFFFFKVSKKSVFIYFSLNIFAGLIWVVLLSLMAEAFGDWSWF